MKTKTTAGSPKGYSYIRFSTADQSKGDSLRRQTEASANWCRAHGVALVENYRDLGVSAWKGKNAETGALSAFLKLAETGRIEKGSYLIIESLDRLSRADVMTAFDLLRSILKTGIRVVTLNDGCRVYDGEQIKNGGFVDLIIAITYMSRAHEESETKSKRVAAAWANKRDHAGERKLTACCVGWLELTHDRKGFRQIPERVAIVKRIFKLASQGVSIHGIARKLREENAETFGRNGRKAACWSAAYVAKLIKSRAVLGEFTPSVRVDGRKQYLDPLPDYYPAVVSRELFATVQQLRTVRPSYRGRGQFNVFSKLAFDRKTGSLMAYVNRDRAKGYHYLVASAALVQRAEYCCWRYDDFKAAFLAVCHKAALAKAPAVERDNADLALARMELADTDAKIERFLDKFESGESSSVDARIRQLEARKGELAQKVKDLESAASAKPKDMATVDWSDNDSLRENLRATVKRITVDAKSKSFRAEFLDGRAYACKVDGDKVTISTAD